MSRDVIVRVKRTGRIHTGNVSVSGRLRLDEGCNLDDARGELEVLDHVPEGTEPSDLCQIDFPSAAKPGDRPVEEPDVADDVVEEPTGEAPA